MVDFPWVVGETVRFLVRAELTMQAAHRARRARRKRSAVVRVGRRSSDEAGTAVEGEKLFRSSPRGGPLRPDPGD